MNLIIYIALLWLLVYIIVTLTPIEPKAKQVINVIAMVITILLVLSWFNLVPNNITEINHWHNGR